VRRVANCYTPFTFFTLLYYYCNRQSSITDTTTTKQRPTASHLSRYDNQPYITLLRHNGSVYLSLRPVANFILRSRTPPPCHLYTTDQPPVISCHAATTDQGGYIFYAGASLAGAGYCRQCRRRPAILPLQLWKGCQGCVIISAQRPPRLAQFNACRVHIGLLALSGQE